MPANQNSIFYQIGSATKTNVANQIANLIAANNTWTGTNNFNKAVTVGTGAENADLTVNGSTTITGNLTVQGVTTTISSDNLEVKDNVIVVNDGANDSAAAASDSGFLFERQSGVQNGAFLFDETLDRFEMGLTAETGNAVSLGNVSLGGLAVNSLLIGTRANTQALGDMADFTAGLNS
jgi:hypothetical protein